MSAPTSSTYCVPGTSAGAASTFCPLIVLGIWWRRLTDVGAIAGMLTGGAFAEMVYNRGNSAEPESLDPHKTSTVYEAHILRDLFEGLVMQDAKADLIPGAAESWTLSEYLVHENVVAIAVHPARARDRAAPARRRGT